MKQQVWFKQIACTSLLIATLALSACGPQSFAPIWKSSAQNGGGMNIPPKVDVVLGVSMNGTMQNIFGGLQPEMASFIKTLEDSGWDYRFVSIPLSEYKPTDASNYPINGSVAVSKYHTNYPVGTWKVPYPGVLHTDLAYQIDQNLFSPFFTLPSFDYTHNDAHETGILNQVTYLTRSDVQQNTFNSAPNGVLRKDALLAVVTLSNGDDRSGGFWPSNNGAWVPNDAAYSAYQGQLLGAAPLVKYYSIAAKPATSCRGYGNWSALRYAKFTEMMNGLQSGSCFDNGSCIDICNNTVDTALKSVAQNLKITRLSFRRRYLVIDSEPNVSTIKVTKYTTSGAQSVPQDPNNGWTYNGPTPVNGVYAIDSPVPMNLIKSGFLIELHGSAMVTGDETANVDYQSAGSVTSH